MMLKYSKRVGNGCHQNGKGYREQLLQGVTCPEKGSETDTPPVLWIRMPTHTSTHTHTHTPLHTTHVGTDTANRYHSNGEVHVTTQYMQCAKKRTQI